MEVSSRVSLRVSLLVSFYNKSSKVILYLCFFFCDLTGRLRWPTGLFQQWQDDSDGRNQLGRRVRKEGQAGGLHPRHKLHRLGRWENEGEPGVRLERLSKSSGDHAHRSSGCNHKRKVFNFEEVDDWEIHMAVVLSLCWSESKLMDIFVLGGSQSQTKTHTHTHTETSDVTF